MTSFSSPRSRVGQARGEPLSSERIDAMVRDVCAMPLGPGREAAREGVIRRLVPLARRIAAKYRNTTCEERDDLFQVACLGLVKAVDGYDPDRGHAFLSYAVPTVVGEVKRHLRDRTGLLRLPRPVQDARQRVNQARSELEQLNGRSVTHAEIAAACDLSPEAVADALRSERACRPRSLDLPGPTLSEVIGDRDPALEFVVERVTLMRALNDLPHRERRILYLRFFDGQTQQQIASAVGLSQMHVSRLLARCLARLREALTEPCRTAATSADPSARPDGDAATMRTAGPRHLPRKEPLRPDDPAAVAVDEAGPDTGVSHRDPPPGSRGCRAGDAPPSGQRGDTPGETPSTARTQLRRSGCPGRPALWFRSQDLGRYDEGRGIRAARRGSSGPRRRPGEVRHGTRDRFGSVRRSVRRDESAPWRSDASRTGAAGAQRRLIRRRGCSAGPATGSGIRPPPHLDTASAYCRLPEHAPKGWPDRNPVYETPPGVTPW
ncbi:hypothetical protein C1I97_33965 [Streptomyces sp. NTH33]|nr:hypothetical protein C1I97_33965 [Streptomyces sp. NTH33]